jgi:PAS domain S-box-containing protein
MRKPMPKRAGLNDEERMVRNIINTILIVEDDIITGMDIRRTLTNYGYTVYPVVAEGENVLGAVEEHHPDLILMDIHLRGGLDGIAVARSVAETSNTPVIFLTANGDEATFQRAKTTAPYGFITKPYGDRELYTAVETALSRSELENKLRESEVRSKALYNATPAMLHSVTLDGTILNVNDMWLSKMGYRREEVLGKNIADFMTEASRHIGLKRGQNFVSDGKSSNIPCQFSTKFGTQIDVVAWATPEKDGATECMSASVIMQDVTENLKMEQMLADERNLFATIIETIPFAVYAKDAEHRFIIANSRAVESLHAASELEILGKTDEELMPKAYAEANRADEDEILRCGRPLLSADVVKRDASDGTIDTCLQVSKVPFYNSAGKIAGIVGINENVTDKRRTEETLQRSEERYRLLFEESKDAVFILAGQGRFIDINPAGVELLGYASKEEFAAVANVADIFTDVGAYTAIVDEIYERGFIQNYEIILRKKDGKPVVALITATAIREPEGAITGLRGFARDITAQRQIEIQLMHAQKMESIGTLAGGIAHDFNNVLAMILGASELTKKSAADPEKVTKYCDMISEATRRGTSIAKQLLLFARSEQMDLNVLSISHIIDEIVALLEHTLPKTITMTTRYSTTNGLMRGDSGYLHQALLNLAINAKDAMPSGGTIEFSASNIDGAAVAKKHASAADCQYIVLSVHDTGLGMDAATRGRIFEPFFSTKERGKGTGLGLAIVHGIVKSHNGFIDVTSAYGEGTTFTMYFPAVMCDTPAAAPAPADTGNGGTETILVVDDEQFIRDTISDILRDNGYSVIEASNGVEALQIYAGKKDEIDLVITDLGMPGISGEELFVKLQEVNPRVKAIVSTGYLEHLTKRDMIEMGVMEVIQKPFNITYILAVVRAALDTELHGVGGRSMSMTDNV